MDYFSQSFRAQRLEGVGRSTMFNSVLDQLASRPILSFGGLHYFWLSNDVFCPGYLAEFTWGGQAYTSAEQYVIHQKALLFKDAQTAEQVLATADPQEHKRLDKEIGHFDAHLWSQHARRIVYEGNCGKFMQQRELEDALHATGAALLAEASPDDTRWGIGLTIDDNRPKDPATWQGENWLGYVLTLLREDIQAFPTTYADVVDKP